MNFAEERKRLTDWVRKNLTGKGVFVEDKLHGINPLERFPTAILFPVSELDEGIDPASDDQEEPELPESGAGDYAPPEVKPATVRRRYIPPSSVGFSFYATGSDLKFQIVASAAVYEKVGRSKSWRKELIGGDESARTVTGPIRINDFLIQKTNEKRNDKRIDKGIVRAGLDVRWRAHEQGWIVTVSLFNAQHQPRDIPRNQYFEKRAETTLFEVDLKCVVEGGVIGDYPRVEYSLLDKEEQELELRYRKHRIYAIGHGAAVNWSQENGRVKELFTEFIPSTEVPQMTADVLSGSDKALEIQYLAKIEDEKQQAIDHLTRFINGYAHWSRQQRASCADFEGKERLAADRIVARIEQAVSRMHDGVTLLETDDWARRAFALANQAMLNQMIQAGKLKKDATDPSQYCWRPFQLGFLLTTIRSTVDDEEAFRDTVDLIWFPTGGGKTEAYLGLIAFLAFYRRLRFPTSGAGTVVLMRYTLRLLTTQQFIRAARMMFAMELLRRANPEELGRAPFSVGLWAGGALSPNTLDQVKKIIDSIRDGSDQARQTLVLQQCPWCATSLDSDRGYELSESAFRFRCTNKQCAFGDGKPLPADVVDESLYQNPPTLLFSTVDKYARLAWDERPGAFLGSGGMLPPALIIQDELHLLSSDLGSIAGIYEAALDTVLRSKDKYPKYIASTATIRNAEAQVKNMYGRDLSVFPPPGLEADDSYFARTVPTDQRAGRMYLGYMAPALDRSRCMGPLAATLAAAPDSQFQSGHQDRNVLLDAWWTMVVYHGSLRGVGNSKNAFYTNVRDFLLRLGDEQEHLDQQDQESDSDRAQRIVSRQRPVTAQLTSLMSAAENSETFGRLELQRGHPECLDAVLATNMISVGLDVARLALMIVNGQPLTTAEYIQASSRVGRSDVPGIVFVNYYRDQARSLSHYENFRAYHESFYRFVEPGSVTPFTHQARKRALHAALVIALRHSLPELGGNEKASAFDPTSPAEARVIQILCKRCEKASPENAGAVKAQLQSLAAEWKRFADTCQQNRQRLCYEERDDRKNSERLLYMHDAQIRGLWETLNSMRQVQRSGLLKML